MYACMWMCKYTCVLEYVNVWKCVLGERKHKPINLNDNRCQNFYNQRVRMVSEERKKCRKLCAEIGLQRANLKLLNQTQKF